ncbi:hypothetical protein [Alicyclobacillus macrosporangiidus]|uniref:Copper amine oxidase N-terminal domain-containing protein n=1 Tax=Alicyclobacillus macrosporangiidus TaxID=392015 RepID=A0A1I7L2J3_9BACL|nr:hypothetical protein [Alicyclobacillus macrosporangiidus]SFV03726.1 hypothetical protein SAMN05421543_12325 [Alicyclobacillus macrosporangiidus]
MRKPVAFLTASTTAWAVLSVLAPGAQAATQTFSPTHIYLNGQDVTNPVHTTAVDPSSKQPTTFLPIYYAMQVLNKLGIQSAWDGHTWSLTVPSSITVNLDNPATSPNQMSIAINGKVVQTAPKLVAKDPASGQDTTFIPIWYLSQVLNRLGISSTWDGTNWRLTQTKPVTQQDMANAMWQVLNATTWDVNSHPSMSDAGVNPTNAPVTAGDVATWLGDWASKAKGYVAHPYNNSSDMSYRPWSLQYEASQDPYTWATINGLYQGTSVSSGSSVITSADESTILANLRWWVTGYKTTSDGWVQLHLPFYSHYNEWQLVLGNVLTQAQYNQMMADDTTYFDEVKVKQSGSNLLVALPDASKSNLAWQVGDGSYTWGYSHGPSGQGFYGGITLTVPNKGPGLTIRMASLNADAHGLTIAYVNTDGGLVYGQPYDIMDLQYPSSSN